MSRQLSDPPSIPDVPSTAPTSICRETVRFCGNRLKGLRAIVLTGSLAREEGSYVRQGSGWRVMGDAEFVLVFADGKGVPGAGLIGVLRQDIEASLKAQGIVCSVGLSAVAPEFLTQSQPHVFSYELRTCGKVVWGEPEILSLIPDFQASEIPLEDAWRLLQNRMVEMLQLPASFPGDFEKLPAETRYRTVKLYLDMATSLLLFAGAYAPTYRARVNNLRELAATGGTAWPFPLDEFTSNVAACTEWKLNMESAPPQAGLAFWKDAISYARQLWRWELARLTGADPALSDHDLVTVWMTQQPYSRRMRGWLFAMRNRGWLRSCKHWPNWARRGWQASPRYWIYAAASEFLFGLSAGLRGAGNENVAAPLEHVLNYLPLRADSSCEAHSWRAIANEICFNYNQLLIETRA